MREVPRALPTDYDRAPEAARGVSGTLAGACPPREPGRWRLFVAGAHPRGVRHPGASPVVRGGRGAALPVAGVRRPATGLRLGGAAGSDPGGAGVLPASGPKAHRCSWERGRPARAPRGAVLPGGPCSQGGRAPRGAALPGGPCSQGEAAFPGGRVPRGAALPGTPAFPGRPRSQEAALPAGLPGTDGAPCAGVMSGRRMRSSPAPTTAAPHVHGTARRGALPSRSCGPTPPARPSTPMHSWSRS